MIHLFDDGLNKHSHTMNIWQLFKITVLLFPPKVKTLFRTDLKQFNNVIGGGLSLQAGSPTSTAKTK